jgi:hypothetical protein
VSTRIGKSFAKNACVYRSRTDKEKDDQGQKTENEESYLPLCKDMH